MSEWDLCPKNSNILLRNKAGLISPISIFAFAVVQDAEAGEVIQQLVMLKAELAAPWVAGC